MCKAIFLDSRVRCQAHLERCEFHDRIEGPILDKSVIVCTSKIPIYFNIRKDYVEHLDER